MSFGRIDQYDSRGRLRTQFDSHFVYQAWAQLDEKFALVKVGISTTPYQRLGQIHGNCPFPIDLAAYVNVGVKSKALACERRILESFSEYKTRGEWLKLPVHGEMKAKFAATSRAIIQLAIGKPVKWQRVSGEQIKVAMGLGLRG